jgi:translation initiation factor 1A
MGKNDTKKQKNKKKKNFESEKEKGEIFFKELGQEYAQILKMLGNGRCEAYCFDGVRRLCHIRGKMRKKIWINVGDIVLIGIREFQGTKGDIIFKYSSIQARHLKAYGELPSNIHINENVQGNPGEDDNQNLDEGFDFELQDKFTID